MDVWVESPPLQTYHYTHIRSYSSLSSCTALFSWFLPEKKLQKKMTLLCVGVHFSFQMTCGLKELLLNGQSQESVVTLFPRLFSCLTVRLGASVGVSAPRDNNTKHTASVHVAGWVFFFCVTNKMELRCRDQVFEHNLRFICVI